MFNSVYDMVAVTTGQAQLIPVLNPRPSVLVVPGARLSLMAGTDVFATTATAMGLTP